MKLPDLSNSRVVAIQVATSNWTVYFLSAYLPCCSGCTDSFKEALDYLDSIISQYAYDSDIIILGNLNADPGMEGGPLASTECNEQGCILLHYLWKYNFLSVHLHPLPN